MNNVHQFAGKAAKWSFWAAILTILVVGSDARAQCPVVMTEFKTGTAARIKTGHPAFDSPTNTLGTNITPLDSNGDYKFYRQYQYEYDLDYQAICPSPGNCTYHLYTSHLTTWDFDYEPQHVIANETECGTVTNGITTSIGTIEHHQGGNSCFQTMTNNGNWTGECPSMPPCGGTRYGYTNMVLSETQRQVTETFTSTANCSGITGAEVRTETLSTLYTTSELVANMTDDALTMLATNKASVSGSAYFNLEERGRCGSAGAMKFRYKVYGARGTETPVVFQVNYWALYRSGGTTGTSPSFQYSTSQWSVVVSNYVVCTGSVQLSPEYLYEPFYEDGVRASLITIEMIAPASCGGDLPGFAQAEIRLGEGPFAAFGLGTCMGTAYPGFLYYSSTGTDPSIDRSALAPFTHAALTETVEDEGGLSQVIVGQKMAEVTDATGGFTVTYYSSTNGEPESFVTSYTVAGQSTSPYRLRISSSEGWYNEFVYTNGWWCLDRGNGHLGEAWQGIVDTEGIVRTNTFSLLGSGGTVLYTETTKFDVLATGHVVPTNRVVGAGGDATTHTWVYNTAVATNHITYGKLAWEIDGQGNWERHTYDDTSGLRTKTASAFGNTATNAADSASRVFEFGYTPFLAGDDGTVRPEAPRFIVEKVKGTVVSQTAVSGGVGVSPQSAN